MRAAVLRASGAAGVPVRGRGPCRAAEAQPQALGSLWFWVPVSTAPAPGSAAAWQTAPHQRREEQVDPRESPPPPAVARTATRLDQVSLPAAKPAAPRPCRGRVPARRNAAAASRTYCCGELAGARAPVLPVLSTAQVLPVLSTAPVLPVLSTAPVLPRASARAPGHSGAARPGQVQPGPGRASDAANATADSENRAGDTGGWRMGGAPLHYTAPRANSAWGGAVHVRGGGGGGRCQRDSGGGGGGVGSATGVASSAEPYGGRPAGAGCGAMP